MSSNTPQSFGPELVLEDYFNGRTKAYGILLGRNGKIKRQFMVDMIGTWDQDVLTLDEHFTFTDGETTKRVWKIKKIDANNYEGTAPDVIGKATGKQHGSMLKWSYVLRLAVDQTTYDITFDDQMFLQPDGVLLNKAVMTKFGFRVGELFLSFNRVGGSQ